LNGRDGCGAWETLASHIKHFRGNQFLYQLEGLLFDYKPLFLFDLRNTKETLPQMPVLEQLFQK
jgi:hypothetical protein